MYPLSHCLIYIYTNTKVRIHIGQRTCNSFIFLGFVHYTSPTTYTHTHTAERNVQKQSKYPILILPLRTKRQIGLLSGSASDDLGSKSVPTYCLNSCGQIPHFPCIRWCHRLHAAAILTPFVCKLIFFPYPTGFVVLSTVFRDIMPSVCHA